MWYWFESSLFESCITTDVLALKSVNRSLADENLKYSSCCGNSLMETCNFTRILSLKSLLHQIGSILHACMSMWACSTTAQID